jgi:hypothetical protein
MKRTALVRKRAAKAAPSVNLGVGVGEERVLVEAWQRHRSTRN